MSNPEIKGLLTVRCIESVILTSVSLNPSVQEALIS